MSQQRRALIAEDEPILALTLQRMLNKLWPELEICQLAENGVQAVQLALEAQPDILFLDIKMPGKTGLEVAQELAEEWPEQQAFPLIVYVTAYDEYAVQAFEHSASDYVLKPVSEERLQKTIQRLQTRLQSKAADNAGDELERVLGQLRNLLPAQHSAGLATPALPATTPASNAEKLHVIRAAVGNNVRMIPIEDVLYFEATDKYINVVTREHSSLIRSSLRELLPQLDSSLFWQIHRSTVVNIRQVSLAQRDESGKVTLKLRDSDDKLSVSRVYAHLFRQM
ncbi:LytR/AlgR family response regulator transcription factor [Undibacterium rugosum]|uniref:Response regulator transcription factor n=1 Tax=Undibacterium rugosum TaxID=2762291 RepID=A0A923I0Y5_9BURK|nr:LytTR family DNA-binding domain-containing protein [Undibacterium rugosum]MBC3935783.1 response regulator transcription factor [Undibacterium rugosum]MBR7778455.1 response regulator transcription factor [Undibacterium rugosum]